MGLTDLEAGLAALCGVIAIVLVVHLVRDVPTGRTVDALIALLELGLVGHLVLGLVELSRDGDGVTIVTFVGYLVALPLLLPVAWLWARGERSRGGTAVLLAAMFVIPFLFVRVHDLWAFRG